MIKGSEIRKADHPIEPLLLDRRSPRAMSGEELSEKELMRLFEAARWAPSFIPILSNGALFMRARQRTLADVLRFACGREQGLGKERSRSCRLQYYAEITRNMVGRVLTNRQIVRRDGANYELLGYENLTAPQVQNLKDACDRKLAEYIAKQRQNSAIQLAF